MIKKLSIKNFKSVKELEIDCSRINLFIGEPNSGKSNILESLGLLSWCGYLNEHIDEYIRLSGIQNLFYDDLTGNSDDDGNRIIRRVIQISPRLENWLYGLAKRNKISPEKFRLPDNPSELHSRSLKRDKDFREFLIEINKKNDNEIIELRKWIREALFE
jgi:AAA15 family ATPase/GTPase